MTVKGKNGWKIIYDNDTGYNDESFWEWWEITDGTKTFTSRDEKDAEWLFDILSNLKDTQNTNVCPQCGGIPDNGFDRCVPPNPYLCTKCDSY